jgi:hypothetical protein
MTLISLASRRGSSGLTVAQSDTSARLIENDLASLAAPTEPLHSAGVAMRTFGATRGLAATYMPDRPGGLSFDVGAIYSLTSGRYEAFTPGERQRPPHADEVRRGSG